MITVIAALILGYSILRAARVLGLARIAAAHPELVFPVRRPTPPPVPTRNKLFILAERRARVAIENVQHERAVAVLAKLRRTA